MWTPYLEFPKKISISFSPRRKSLHLSHSRISSIDSDGRRRPAPSPATAAAPAPAACARETCPLQPTRTAAYTRRRPSHAPASLQTCGSSCLRVCRPPTCSPRPPARDAVPPTHLPTFRPVAPAASACCALSTATHATSRLRAAVPPTRVSARLRASLLCRSRSPSPSIQIPVCSLPHGRDDERRAQAAADAFLYYSRAYMSFQCAVIFLI